MDSRLAMNQRTYSSRSLHGQVVHELGLRILRGDYPPGSGLPNEEELSLSLDVSRTALREAIKVLTAKGLIEARPKVGTRVRPKPAWNMLDPDVLTWRCETMQTDEFARNLLEMREIVEPAAAALAARHRSDEEMQLLEAAFAEMAASTNLDEWVRSDLHFHKAILNATRNELLVPLAFLVETALETLLTYSARQADNPKASLGEHERVLQAIRERDEDSAFHAMSFLLSNTRRTLAKSLNALAGQRPLRTTIPTAI